MPVVNLFLDPLDATNPNFIDLEDRKTLEKEAEIIGSNSDSEVEHEPPTPPDSPSANLKPGIIVPHHAPITKCSAWGEVEGFINAILGELQDISRDSHLSHAERYAKSQKLKARFGDQSVSDKNPLKTVIYSKFREILEQEEEMRAVAAAARPKKIQAKLTPAGTRKRIRSSDRPMRKYTWKFPEIKNKGNIRARKQKMVGAKALMDLKAATEDQDRISSSGSLAVEMNDPDDEDSINSLFDETSDIEEYESDGHKTDEERDIADQAMIDSESEGGMFVSEADDRHDLVHGNSEDAQSPGTSKMYNEPTPLRSGIATTTSRRIPNRVKYWLDDMTEAAARNNDVVLMRALASLNGGVTIDSLDPVEELRVREMVEWYESAHNH